MLNTWSITFDKTNLNFIWKRQEKYKKATAVQEKKAFTQQSISGTQTEIFHVASQIDADKYIASNLMEMSDSSGTDSDDN